MHDSFNDATLRDMAVELCLTIPTSLDKKVPHLHLLVKPLVLSLQPRHDRSNDIITIGYAAVPALAPFLRDFIVS